MEDFWASAIQSGFAVAVAGYLLVRMESRLQELTNAIKDLQVAIVNRGGI
ncbi:MAG: YvrJ family protein [Synergistota bacterium]|nr:YvrJ family protein [Synergistota bacterium]